jgi:hypothetical protein
MLGIEVRYYKQLLAFRAYKQSLYWRQISDDAIIIGTRPRDMSRQILRLLYTLLYCTSAMCSRFLGLLIVDIWTSFDAQSNSPVRKEHTIIKSRKFHADFFGPLLQA